MEGLELPNWNSAFLDVDIDCSPPKHPLARVTLKDGNTQRVGALGHRAPAAAACKPTFSVVLAAPVTAANHADAENDAGAAAAATEAPRSAPRRTHTPTRTGLTARAVRMPSRLGQTPGAKQAELFEVPVSGTARTASKAQGVPSAAATGGAGGNLKSILKRLNFSTTKSRGAPASTLPAAAPRDAPPSSAAPPTMQQRQPAAGVVESTIKQLHFDMGTTPAASTAAKPAGGARHVRFGAGTVSPAVRSQTARAAALPAGPAHAWRTPEPTIREESSEGSEEGAGVAGSSVNSARAGSTPYDRRLSSLFHKYQVAGTPDLPDAELDELVAEGAVSSPSWSRLSSASVPESIRELSKKYSSNAEGSASPMPQALAPAEGQADADAATPVRAGADGSGRSPTAEPTPHFVLNSMMKRNALYESPPATLTVEPALPATEPAAEASPCAAAELSPASAVAQLLGPLLRATLNEIEADQAAAAARQETAHASAPPASASPADSLSSPAKFYGFPAMEGTPGASTGQSSRDGVPRDADGIPIATPGTVTVRRGSYTGRLGAVLEQEDHLAANLFQCSFSPSDSPNDSLGGQPGGSPCGGDVLEFGGFNAGAGALSAADAVTPQAGTDAAADFSFFPTAAALGPGPDSQEAAAGVTPELAAGYSGLQGVMGRDSNISPEILGFYEQQAQREAGTSSSQPAGRTAAMPRSIIKSGRPLTQAGSPVLGHAQRGAADAAPPPTITKELRALMADMRLADPSAVEQMGTVSALSPVRTGSLRGFLGGLARAITPVRRSARKGMPSRSLEAMLEETGYSYVPNAALMSEDAQPMREAAAAKAAKKTASQGEPSLAGGVAAGAERGQPEVSSTPIAHGYSTEAEGQPGSQGAVGVACTPASDTPATAPGSQRLSLRRLRTPAQRAQVEADEVSTPQAAPMADVPVAQDASPQLSESPTYVGAAATAQAAAAAEDAALRSYNFRSSTVKKARQSMGGMGTAKAAPTPKAALTPKARQVGEGGKEQARGTPPQGLSPTELNIRSSLRRSARKSKAPK